MLIRSQDMNRFININNVEKINMFQYRITEEKCSWNIECPRENDVIGRYSSRKKALEVLTLIGIAYEEYENCKYHGTARDWIKAVFKMPKDEDVVINK